MKTNELQADQALSNRIHRAILIYMKLNASCIQADWYFHSLYNTQYFAVLRTNVPTALISKLLWLLPVAADPFHSRVDHAQERFLHTIISRLFWSDALNGIHSLNMILRPQGHTHSLQRIPCSIMPHVCILFNKSWAPPGYHDCSNYTNYYWSTFILFLYFLHFYFLSLQDLSLVLQKSWLCSVMFNNRTNLFYSSLYVILFCYDNNPVKMFKTCQHLFFFFDSHPLVLSL